MKTTGGLPTPGFKLKKAQNVMNWLKKARTFMEANSAFRRKDLLNHLIEHTIGIEDLQERIQHLTFTKLEGESLLAPGLGDFVVVMCHPKALARNYAKHLRKRQKKSPPVYSSSDEDASDDEDAPEEEDWMTGPPIYAYDTDGEDAFYWANDQMGQWHWWDESEQEWVDDDEDDESADEADDEADEDEEEDEYEDEAEVATSDSSDSD
jgi:hypothetical protein